MLISVFIFSIAIKTESFAEEKELVARATSGDTGAFEILYRKYVGRVYAVCLRVIADSNKAEELTQEVFIQAWEKLPSFRGESLFSTWLHRIAVNFTLEEIRSGKRHQAKIESSDDLESYDYHSIEMRKSPEDTIDLEDAIKTLPAQARAVFVLHDIEGFRHEEIAVQLGVAAGTSKAHLHRARTLLKKVLER